jgi:hypothetical protein
MCEEVTTAKSRHHEATSPKTDLGIVHLTVREAQRTHTHTESLKDFKTAQTSWKPPTELGELTISSLDSLIM